MFRFIFSTSSSNHEFVHFHRFGVERGGSTQQSILSQDIDRCMLDCELVASLQHLADSQVSLAALSTACPTSLPSRRASHFRFKA